MKRSFVAQAAYDSADLFLNTISLESEPRQHLYRAVIAEAEKGLIERVLITTHGNQQKASDILGINRATLRVKLKRHGMLNTNLN